MDQPVDEQTASDLAAIAESRRLTAGQCQLLARNVTGAVRPNRDIFLWVLANLLAVAFAGRRACGAAAGTALDCALQIVLAPAAPRRALLARLCAGHPDVRVSAEGVVSSIPGLDFEAGPARIEDALAFAEFFVTGADGALLPCFRQAVEALTPGSGAAVRDAVSMLSRGIAAWRRDRLPLGRHERLFAALIGFLLDRPAARRGGGLLAFDDDDIVGFWRHCIDRGDRLMFRTAVERFRDFAVLVRHLQALKNLGSAADLDAVAARLETEAGDGFAATAEGAAEAAVLAALRSFPGDPNALTGVERDLVGTLAALMPFHRERPVSVLRVLAFGPVQMGIANRLRRGSGGPGIAERATCADARDYDAVAGRLGELCAHLDALRLIAAALRFGDAGAADGVDPKVLRDTVERGEAALRRLRRAGFARPRAELAGIFAGMDGAIADFHAVVSAFMAELDRLGARQPLGDRFGRDKPVFAEILRRAYAAEHEETADV